jgi:DNA recombination protein RmuC
VELLLFFALLLLLAVVVCQILILRRPAPSIDLGPTERAIDRNDRTLREELARGREESDRRLEAFGAAQQRQTELVIGQLNAIRETVEKRLTTMQHDNAEKLELMRRTVDEQLQTTLDRRLRESFESVSTRLEQVHKGLGEMQTLALGVGDLKRIMTGVRARGIWGELQLRTLLEEMLTPDQFAYNVAVTGTNERVEFAIRLPGAETDSTVFLPIDSKFPLEDYERLIAATDPVKAEECALQLERRIKACAREISEKYICVPRTTEFAILYLPSEALYAEVLRRPGMVDELQRAFRVTLCGPTTLAAFLNSLRLGFRTLAIQQRSGEVWQLLGQVKTEFGKYSDILEKVQKKLQEAANTVESGLTRTRVLERKLDGVEEKASEQLLPASEGPLFTNAGR